MQTGVIEAVVKARVEKRDEAVLPSAWVGGSPQVAPTGERWLTRSSEVVAARGLGPVLAMVPSTESPAFASAVAEARAGARVYVLAPEGLAWEETELLTLPTVLVRRVPEVPAAACVGLEVGHLWMGPVDAPWSLQLTAQQRDGLRELFKRLFWHHASDEAWLKKGGAVFRPAGERPFEVPTPGPGAPMWLAPAGTRIDEVPSGASVHISAGGVPTGSPATLWLPPSHLHHERLIGLVAGGTAVRWSELDLPDLVAGEGGGYMLLPGSAGRLHIELGAAQATEVRDLLAQPATWSFAVNVRLGDHAQGGSRLWLPTENAARPVTPEQRIELPALPVDALRSVPDASPSAWPTPSPLSLAVHYQWRVDPPRVPRRAGPDGLIAQWAQVDEDFGARLARVQGALQDADGKQGSIGRAFETLLGAMRGFGRKRDELLRELVALQECRPSAGDLDDARSTMERLRALEEASEKLHLGLDEAERDARLERQREEQKARWGEDVADAKRGLIQLEKLRAEADTENARLARELAALPETAATADGTGDKVAEKKAAKKAARDLRAMRSKLTDELAAAERFQKSLAHKEEVLRARANAQFVFQASAAPSLKRSSGSVPFVPPAAATGRAASAAMPGLALPRVGVLRARGSERYLVITRWDELEQGEREAQRLGARLVAAEGA